MSGRICLWVKDTVVKYFLSNQNNSPLKFPPSPFAPDGQGLTSLSAFVQSRPIIPVLVHD